VWGFLLVTSQRGHDFEFLNHFDKPWAPVQIAIFMAQIFLETRRSAASIEPLINLLTCLELKLWPKNPTLPQNQKIAENALSLPLAPFQLATTCRWNMIASYWNPRKTREVL